jgi:hypothetical protein
MCIEEQKDKGIEINRFVGFRELKVSLKNIGKKAQREITGVVTG